MRENAKQSCDILIARIHENSHILEATTFSSCRQDPLLTLPSISPLRQ